VISRLFLKVAVSRDVAPYSLVDIDPYFRGAYYLHHQGDDIVNIYQTTWRDIPEDSHLHTSHQTVAWKLEFINHS
jgi:hypothetical protein